MTEKQFNKLKIGDKVSMFYNGKLIQKHGFNIIVKMPDDLSLRERHRNKYCVAALISQNGQMFIDSDKSEGNFFTTLREAMIVLHELNCVTNNIH